MKKTIIFYSTIVLLFASCDKEYLNPSAASEQQVIGDVNGLISLANGLQYKYTIGRASPNYTLPTIGGLLGKELVNLNTGNTDEQRLMEGGTGVVGGNSVITNNWA